MAEILIPILAFLAVATIGVAAVVAIRARRYSVQPRLRALDQGGLHGTAAGGEAWIERSVRQVGDAASRGQFSDKLRQQLAQAGYHDRSAAATYIGLKLMLAVLGLTGTAAALVWTDLALPFKLYGAALGGILFFLVPNIVLRNRRVHRRTEVQHYLPDAVDLLEICVSAGMGLDMAWNAVSDEIRQVSHHLADEMALTTLEMQLGAPRTQAMRNMAGRTGVSDLSSLVALLVQSDRFGTSVAEALRTFAETMRETRSQRAEEEAEKMPVKLLFPMVLLIFPVMFIVTAGPAGIMLAKVISEG